MKKWEVAKNKLINPDWERKKVVRNFFCETIPNIGLSCLVIAIFVPFFLFIVVCAIIERITGKTIFIDINYYDGF